MASHQLSHAIFFSGFVWAFCSSLFDAKTEISRTTESGKHCPSTQVRCGGHLERDKRSKQFEMRSGILGLSTLLDRFDMPRDEAKADAKSEGKEDDAGGKGAHASSVVGEAPADLPSPVRGAGGVPEEPSPSAKLAVG